MSTQPISPPALPFVVEPLGLLPYADAWARQRELAAQRAVDLVGDTRLVVEHPHVYTLGSKGKRAHLLVTEAALQAQGIPVLDVDRGGDITYHGPGQLVAYPILRLKDWNVKIVDYLRLLEAVLIEVCLGYGLVAQRIQGYTGVWIGDAKVAAIGAKLDGNGITRHGCALNRFK